MEAEAEDVLGPWSALPEDWLPDGRPAAGYGPSPAVGPAKTGGTLPGEGKDEAVEGEGNPRLELDVAGDVSMCA